MDPTVMSDAAVSTVARALYDATYGDGAAARWAHNDVTRQSFRNEAEAAIHAIHSEQDVARAICQVRAGRDADQKWAQDEDAYRRAAQAAINVYQSFGKSTPK